MILSNLLKNSNFLHNIFLPHYIFLMFLAFAGIAISVGLFIVGERQDRDRLQIEFNKLSDDGIDSLRRGIEESLQQLESLSAFYVHADVITRKEFHDFIQPFLARNPGIQALGWIPRVPDSSRDAYERAAQGDGFPGFQFTEMESGGAMIRTGRRREYFPAYFVEPFSTNKMALGFDLASEPVRRATLQQARDSGTVVVTARIMILEERTSRSGYLALHPLYGKGPVPGSIQARRARLTGFVVGVFQIGNIIEKYVSHLRLQDIEIRVYDDTAQDSPLLYVYPPSLHASSREVEDRGFLQKSIKYGKTIEVAGKKWTFVSIPTPQYLAAGRTWHPLQMMGGGLVITGFINLYIFLMVNRAAQTRKFNGQIVQAKQELEREMAVRIENEQILRASEERFRQIFENDSIGMVIVGQDYTFLKVNRAICDLLEYAEEELVGMSLETITHPDDRRRSIDKTQRFFKGEFARFQMEKRFMKKNGEIVWARVTAAEIQGPGGEKFGLGIIDDITELQESGQRYRSLFENILEGFAYCKMVYEEGRPRDFIYLEVNNAFEKMTGLRNVAGKRVTELIPGIREAHPELFEIYGRVSMTGKTEKFEMYLEPLEAWLSISAYSTQKEHFIAVFDNITDRKQRERQLEAISRLSIALRSTSTRAEQFPIILFHTVDLLDIEAASIGMLEQTTGETVVELGWGDLQNLTGRRLPPKEGVIGHVIATSRTYASSDFLNDPRLIQPDPIKGLNAAVCVPLVAEKQTIGGLMVACKKTIKKEEVQLLTAIGEIAAIAIHRTTLHEKALQQMQHLSALHDIDVAISSSLDLRVTLKVLLGHVTTELGADAAAVLLMNPDTKTLTYAAGHGFRTRGIEQTRTRLGEGCAGRAALERRIISVPDNVIGNNMCEHVRTLRGEAFVSHHVAPLVIKGRVKGVLEVFSRSPLVPDPAWTAFFEALAGQAAIAIDNASLFNDLQVANDELVLAYDATIEGWSRALDLRDKETEGHSRRVTDMTVTVARAMGMSEEDLVHVRRGALLHDIGKMGIPDNILLKPGKLSEEEWVIMRKHPVFAHDLLSPIAFLQPALDVPSYHHEKWDGTGYPEGLKGDQIPLAARIFSVVDVWDALGSDRPYRPAWPREKILQYLKDRTEKDFDPGVVDVFFRLFGTDVRDQTRDSLFSAK